MADIEVWKIVLLVIGFIILVLALKFIGWTFKGLATIIMLLLTPDRDAKPRPLRPKGLSAKYMWGLNWDKARKLYVPRKRFK